MPALDTSAGIDMSGMFEGCTNLVCLTSLNTTLATGQRGGLFDSCFALTAPNSLEQTDLTDSNGAVYVNASPCP